MALQAKKEIQPGEEFFVDYGYKFDSGPKWYKELFLKFMHDHPEEEGTIQRIAVGRSHEVLDMVYQAYLIMRFNSTQMVALGETN